MRKLTFDALPGAIAEILERLDRVEQLLSGKTPSKVKKLETKSAEESMDINEAAKMLNVTVASVYSYVKNNKIPFEKKGGKLTFSPTALETWMKEKNKSKKKTAKKSTSKKNTAKKSTSKKITAEKNTAKKSAAKKSTAKKSAAKKNTLKKELVKKDTGNKEVVITPAELITPQEAENIFNKALPSIYYAIRTRKLQAVEKRGRAQYYSKDELAKALKGKQKKSRPSA
ncbi:MAG: helix-turn-helix domain-containing protein [Prolixibacteraceae bacterium]|nr:helix-turn-helix domain-containing protein [Prolixibacteraceae bacterium]